MGFLPYMKDTYKRVGTLGWDIDNFDYCQYIDMVAIILICHFCATKHVLAVERSHSSMFKAVNNIT
eukprot:scaffold85062_cov22-Prasinocladus_malaysianus.AAC.1